MLQQLGSRMGRLWCILMHDSPMWPVHGHYECRTCGRQYAAFVDEPLVNVATRGGMRAGVPAILAWHSEGGKQWNV